MLNTKLCKHCSTFIRANVNNAADEGHVCAGVILCPQSAKPSSLNGGFDLTLLAADCWDNGVRVFIKI